MANSDIVLVPMEPSDVPTLQIWFEDEELSKRLGGMLPLQKYFDYVQSESNYFAWMALEGGTPQDGGTPVGAVFMQIESNEPDEADEPQSFAFLVRPRLRSRGYGRRILQRFMGQPEASDAKKWRVGVEADNIACQRCLASVGFVPENAAEDEEGFLQYIQTR
jgi:RimJ/RimL family protein N-acetyltransferase